jgi:HAMP domain-containing protein
MTLLPASVEAEMESSTTCSDLNAAPEFNSSTLPLWKLISQKRLAFFARYEAVFLCLLGSICLICGLGCLLGMVAWLAHQIDALEYLAHGVATSDAIIPR